MMKITLWQLNESYQALLKLAQAEFQKDKHKLAYKLSRVVKSAKAEVDALGESLNDLMCKCGFEPGSGEVAQEKLKDYNDQAKAFMRETQAEIWGDPILIDDLGDVAISAFDLALLDWLIVETTEQPKTNFIPALDQVQVATV